MRVAFAAAVAAACLSLTAQPASAQGIAITDVSVSSLTTSFGTEVQTETRFGDAFRLGLRLVAPTGISLRGNRSDRRLGLDCATFDYFPFEQGLRLTVGGSKDGAPKAFGRNGAPWNVRGVGLDSRIGYKRRLSAMAGIGYDENLDDHTRFSIDAGVRKTASVTANSAILRMAERSTHMASLGALQQRYAPALRVSLVRSF